MDKLIELLNEFEDYNKNCEWGKQYNYYSYRKRYEGDFERDLTENCMNIVFIISKTFGFIKWLVDNDKIDHKIYEDMKFTAIKQGALIDKKSGSTAQETREIIKNGCIDTFIALLAISDTPIQDLCVWLK